MKQFAMPIASAAVIALSLGVTSRADTLKQAEPLPLGSFVIAADETQDPSKVDNNEKSAKMGKDDGTQLGDNQGLDPESDTKKIDQPARENPTTGNASDEAGANRAQ